MTQAKHEIAVIIVNWNKYELTRAAVKSVLNGNIERILTIVIDNGSSDNSCQRLSEEFPGVLVIANEENRGFAAASNQGAQIAAEREIEYVFFLNNDAKVEYDTLKVLKFFLNDNPKAGAVSPVILYTNKPDTIWYGGGVVNLWIGYVGHRWLRSSIHKLPQNPITTDYLTGCAFLARTDLINRIGGFDIKYGMYSEDVDLSLQMRKMGWSLWIHPDAKAFHEVSASAGGELSPLKAFHRGKSHMNLVLRWIEFWQIPSAVVAGLTGILLLSMRLTLKGNFSTIAALWSGLISGLIRSDSPIKYKLEYEDQNA